MPIYIVEIGLVFLLQLAHGRSSNLVQLNLFFVGDQPPYSYVVATVLISIVIVLLVLLQLTHDTSDNSVH